MRLGQLLVEPRVVSRGGDDAWGFLREPIAGLAADHPLPEAVRKLAGTGGAPRRAALSDTVDILDLGADAEHAGLVLLRPDRESRVASPATWVVWGLSRPTVNLFLYPELSRFSEGIGEAESLEKTHDILSSNIFSDSYIETNVTVEHALTPLTYRVYPDTPIAEIQHLMLRRGLTAVPVVGANHEVLGVVTARHLLPHILPGSDSNRRSAPQAVVAANVMSRSVLCVSGGEGLLVASRSMVARGVSRLPVVRHGELIGFLDRDTVMRAFSEAFAMPGRSGTG